MNEFAHLLSELETSPNGEARINLVRHYLLVTNTEDRQYAISLLLGLNSKLAVLQSLFEDTVSAVGIPDWLITESNEHVGDRAETVALLLGSITPSEFSLSDFMARYEALKGMSSELRVVRILEVARLLSREECFVWLRLVSGTLHPKVSRAEISKAVSRISNLEAVLIEQRLLDEWEADETSWAKLTRSAMPITTMPFAVASMLEQNLELLGESNKWQFEHTWTGLRCQLIRHNKKTILWSADSEIVTDVFPEVTESANNIEDGCVLDGIVIVKTENGGGSQVALERRISRKPTARTLREIPCTFVAFDVLRYRDEDFRAVPLYLRREKLEEIVGELQPSGVIELSHVLKFDGWEHAQTYHASLTQDTYEGIVLKHREAAYEPNNEWHNLKRRPERFLAVLMYAERGESAGRFNHYSFGVWDGSQLTPVAKTELLLSSEDRETIDVWIVTHSIDRFGPVRSVPPELVFELEFHSREESEKRKSGIVLRGVSVVRWLPTADATKACSLEELLAM